MNLLPMHAWHPMFVHFPLSLLLAGVALELVGWVKGNLSLRKASLVLLTAGLLMALPAVATGLLAYGRVDHSEAAHAMMTTHRNLMLVAVGLFAAAVAWRWRADDRLARRPWNVLYAGLLAAATAVLVVGSDRGADLVFGHAIGVPSSRLEAVLHERRAEPADAQSPADATVGHDDSRRPAHEH